MLILQGFKRKLILTPETAQEASAIVGCIRQVYNVSLEQRTLAYRLTGKSIFYSDQEKELKELKEAFPYLKQVPAQSLQQCQLDLQTAFDRFFTGISKYPTFRRKFVNDSFRLPTPNKFNITKLTKRKGAITVPKLGELRFHRDPNDPIIGKPKSATIKREAGEWYISILCLVNIPDSQPITTEKASSAGGLDRGCHNLLGTSSPIFTVEQALQSFKDTEKALAQLEHLLTITDTPEITDDYYGSLISLRHQVIERYEKRIKKHQRRLAFKKKGSKAFKKIKKNISKVHRKLKNYRRDVLHQLSTWIVENQDINFVEELDVEKMTKSNKGTLENPGTDVKKKSALNKLILQQGWGYLRIFLKYKSKWLGKLFDDEVNPAYTSIKCYECRYINKQNRKGDIFLCLRCGHEDHADVNAAKNVLRDGLSRIASGSEQHRLLGFLGTVSRRSPILVGNPHL